MLRRTMMRSAFYSFLFFWWGQSCVQADRTPLEEEMVVANCLFGQMIQGMVYDKPNVVFSPLSLHASLSLARLGSRGLTTFDLDDVMKMHGKSREFNRIHYFYAEYLTRLLSEQKVYGNVIMASILSVGPRVSIDPSFIAQARDAYKAHVTRRDTSRLEVAETEINDFVDYSTNGMIKQIIPRGSIHDNTSIVLASALVFNAFWKNKFEPFKTRKQDFTRNDGTIIQVDMMTDTRVVLHKTDNQYDADIVQIPLTGDKFALFLLVPRKKDRIAAIDVCRNSLLSGLTPKKIELALPKFQIDSRLDLQDDLQRYLKLAMSLFDADFSAISHFERHHQSTLRGDLDEITTPHPRTATRMMWNTFVERFVPVEYSLDKPFISNVFHGAMIEINEAGVLTYEPQEARVPTQSADSDSSVVHSRVVADKPFMFIIQEIQSALIFVQGKYSGY